MLQFQQDTNPSLPLKTVLYNNHLKLTSRMAEFAGYMMPLWYSSIANEHRAVRQTAGLFDVTHMGNLNVQGPDAAQFLNIVCTNDVSALSPGQAQYSIIVDENGSALDDIIVYFKGGTDFMVVVNAANEQKIINYLQNLRIQKNVEVINVHVQDRKDAKVDLALQGPASLDIILQLTNNPNLKFFHFTDTVIAKIPATLARTGYTGARQGFELFVHPNDASALWELLLEKGKQFGLEPCGLGARDSLRIEAGLPLYGHELDGEFDISPFEAGYPWAVKLEKDFFIGKAAMQKRANSEMEIIRIETSGQKGVRPVRPHDAIVLGGTCIGSITSSAGVEEKIVALAYVKKGAAKPGDAIEIYYVARNANQVQQGRLEKVGIGQKITADIPATVLPRFAKF